MNPLDYILLFDWGSVLAPNDSILAAEHLSKKYDCDYDELLNALNDEDDFSIDDNYEGYIKRINEKFNIPREDIITWKNKTGPNETLDYCFTLKEQGCTLYLLSDQMKFRTDYIRNTYDLSCFTQAFFSSEIGYIKQNEKAFLHVIKEMNTTPQNVIFIDDNTTNINVANSLGINGILYVGLEDLKTHLQL